jgi:ParB family chromosome partitioning protein
VAEDKRGMGRGLAAILPRNAREDVEGLREVPLELIDPNPSQPRTQFDEQALLDLAKSIGARGLLQPVVVRPLPGGRYELVAGERRVRAAKIAELASIPAIVRDADDAERLELALAENMAREDLNAVEEARACATLVDDLGLTKEEVGRRVGRSRVAISNLIRLLDLPEEALELIEAGDLSEGHGRAVLLCKNHAERKKLARAAHDGGWSVRETERRARAAEDDLNPQRRAPTVVHPDLAEALGAAEDTLSAAIGCEVRVRARGERVKVEFELDTPAEAVKLAERILD